MCCAASQKAVDDEMDITPMIDMTFLLLVFFIVASTPDVQTAVELPPAHFGQGVSQHRATLVTVAQSGDDRIQIYLADGKVGPALPDDQDEQERLIRQAVEDGIGAGKSEVIIKAERGVRHREVSRIAAAAGSVEGARLYVAIFEVE